MAGKCVQGVKPGPMSSTDAYLPDHCHVWGLTCDVYMFSGEKQGSEQVWARAKVLDASVTALHNITIDTVWHSLGGSTLHWRLGGLGCEQSVSRGRDGPKRTLRARYCFASPFSLLIINHSILHNRRANMSAPSADLLQDIATRFVLTAPAEQLL